MELEILHFLESIHTEFLDKLMYGFTLFGEKGIFWIVLALLFLFILPKRYRKVGLSVGIALVLSIIVCNLILKNAFERPRPFWEDTSFTSLFNMFEKIDDWSFPSGHTSASFAAATAIRFWRKPEGVIAIIIAVLVAISRMYLCVHYPTDVLVSVILGIIFGTVGYYLGRYLIDKNTKLRLIFKAGAPYTTLFKSQI